MFKLIRRISSSVFPRNDRPWADDATSTAPTIRMKRKLSSVDMDLDTSVGSLSKKSRRGKDADPSDDEEPTSSPVTSSPLLPRSSPPPEEVKEVTTGVKEIELDQKPDVPLSNLSEVVEPSVTLDTGTSVQAEEGAEAEECATPEQRPEEDTPEVEGLQDPVEGGSTDETQVKPMERFTDDSGDATKTSEEGVKPSVADSVSPTKVSRPKSTVKKPMPSQGKPQAKA